MELSTEIKALLALCPKAIVDFVSEIVAEKEFLTAENVRLRAILNQNCTNSSVPPSKSNFIKPKSLRVATGRKPGGQPGHEGITLRLSETPDVIVEHKASVCQHCAAIIPSDATESRHVSRQVVDIEIRRVITEHRATVTVCPECGKETTAPFPQKVDHYLQYGPLFSTLLLYLNQGNFVPFDRLAKFCKDMLQIPVSPGTIVNIVQKSAQDLAASMEFIKKQLLLSTVLHFDETGTRIYGKTFWRHSVGNPWFTFLKSHIKRGNEATDEIGILPFFTGTAVHDFWKSYFSYVQCRHAMCNAHILRELNGVEENFKRNWPKHMKEVLLDAKKLTERAEVKPTPAEIAGIELRYDEALAQGYSENPVPEKPLPVPKKRGPVAQTKELNLLKRMTVYKDSILLFLRLLEVPFTNNSAERDIRMSKTQQKVSGGFRSQEGCDAFDAYRSYIATAIKQEISVFEATLALTSGHPLFTDAP
ncbi:MAG: IS66 family transposase [Deltaproteobacteria bacterium]